MRRLGGPGAPDQEPAGRGRDRHRRQVRRLRGLLQEPQRGADPRRLRQRRARWCGAGSRPRSSRRATWTRLLGGVDGILVPGGFGARGTGGHGRGGRVRAADGHAVLRHLLRLPVGGHRVRAQRVRPLRAPTRPRSTPTPSTRSSTSCRTCWASRRWAAPCGWAPTPASSSRGSRAAAIYGATEMRERHRHRYEFNKEYESCLTQGGLVISGKTPDGKFVEIVEIARTIPGTWRCSSTPSSSPSPWCRTRSSPTSCARASSNRRARGRPGRESAVPVAL